MVARAFVLLAVLLAACSGESSRFAMPPNVDGSATLIAVIHDREPPRGFAFDATTDDWRLGLEVVEDATIEVDLLAYDCTLDLLALDAGTITFTRDGRRPLVEPARSWSTIGTLDALDWVENEDLPARTRELRMAGEAPTLCSTIDVVELDIPGENEDPRLLARDEGGLVVIGSKAGRLYHLDLSTMEVRPAYVGSVSSGGPWNTAVRDDVATLFFSSGRGCLGIGDGSAIRELGCLPQSGTATATVGNWAFIDANNTSVANLHAAVLTEEGRMFRFRSGAFEAIPLVGTTDVDEKGAVQVMSEDDILFAGPRQQQIVHFDGVRARANDLPLGMFDKVTSVLRGRDGRQPMALSNSGRMFQRDSEGAWKPFSNPAIPQARRILAFSSSYYVAGETQVVEVLDDATVCPNAYQVGDDVRRMIAVDDRIVLVTDPPQNGGGLRIIVLTPQRPEQLCR